MDFNAKSKSCEINPPRRISDNHVVQTIMSEQQHAENLRASRLAARRNSVSEAKKKLQNLKNVASFGSLLKHIDPFIDWLFGIALIFAILKDILDIINTALIVAGGVGWLLIIIFTGACSIMIFLIMFITGASGSRKMAKAFFKRTMMLFGVTLAEFIPAVDLFPLESALVVIAFWMTLAERKSASQEKNQETQLSQAQPA